MKRNIILFVATALTLLLAASCNRDVEYEFIKYATFYSTSFTVNETAGEVSVPVILCNSKGSEVQLSVKLNEGKAHEGTDYELISPASGILTFSGDKDTLDIVIGIKSFEGELTGTKDFSVQIASLTSGAQVGSYSTAKVAINDVDHPLSGFVGEWDGTLVFASEPPAPMPTTLDIKIDEDDETYSKMIITGLEPNYAKYALPVYATYDKENSKVIVPQGQLGMYVSDSYNFVITGLDDAWENLMDVEFAYDPEANTLTQLNIFGMLNTLEGSLYSVYVPGAVFTKK